MVKFLFGALRLLLGLAGAVWLLTGLLGIVETSIDRAWGVTLRFALLALVGFCLAYAAFVRAPWERREDSNAPAT